MDVEPVYIIGAGGIGCAVGYALRTAGWPVTFVERHPGKLEWGARHGIHVDNRPPIDARFVSFDDWRCAAESIVILSTKCYDNAAVLDRLPKTAQLIPIQNGFDPDLERWAHDLEGIASFVSECVAGETHTRITRPGKLHLGWRTDSESLHSAAGKSLIGKIAGALRMGRLFGVLEVAAINPYKYSKLMYNAAISPLAAAAGIDNGKLLSVPATRQLFFAFLQENYRILSDAGIALGKIGPFHPATVASILRRPWVARLLAKAFEPSLRGTYCSMAPDLPRGITEIDYYNQRLVHLAADRPCPLNRAAVQIIKEMEKQRIAPNLDALAELTAIMENLDRKPSLGAAVPHGARREP